jgi:flagellar hook-basal body complex protein FliE
MMGLDDTTGFTSVIGSAAESLVSGLLDAANTYYSNVNAANEAAGTSTGQFAEVLQENIDAINTESAEAAKAVEEMASKMDTAM